MTTPDDKLKESIRDTLNRSLDDLDTETALKLGRLKYHALDSTRSRSGSRLRTVVPAVFVVVCLVFLFNSRQPELLPSPSIPSFDMGLLTETEDLGFYEEEIEFYQWLSEVLDEEGISYKYPSDSVSRDRDVALRSGDGGEHRPKLGTAGISRGFRG